MRKVPTQPVHPVAAEPSKITRIYLAGPLFTLQERRMNRELARAIERQIPASVFLPQDLKHDDKYNDQRAFGLIFKACLDGIDSCHCMVAWLDGPDSDSGTSFEVGYAFSRRLPVVGVRTDFRLNQERGVNVMLSRACTAFVYRPSFDENVDELAKNVARAVVRVLKVPGNKA